MPKVPRCCRAEEKWPLLTVRLRDPPQVGYLATPEVVGGSNGVGEVRALVEQVVDFARSRGLLDGAPATPRSGSGGSKLRVAVMTGSSSMDVTHNAVVQILEL